MPAADQLIMMRMLTCGENGCCRAYAHGCCVFAGAQKDMTLLAVPLYDVLPPQFTLMRLCYPAHFQLLVVAPWRRCSKPRSRKVVIILRRTLGGGYRENCLQMSVAGIGLGYRPHECIALA